MRKNDHDAKWTVFYIFTDLNSEVNGNLMDAHEMGEAYDLLGLPSVQYISASEAKRVEQAPVLAKNLHRKYIWAMESGNVLFPRGDVSDGA